MRLFTVNGNTSDPAFKLYTFIKQHSGCRASAAARMLFNECVQFKSGIGCITVYGKQTHDLTKYIG